MMEPMLRHSIENAIERLIGLLDVIDGDPDLEQEPDESYLSGFSGTCDDDLEFDFGEYDPPGRIAGGQGL